MFDPFPLTQQLIKGVNTKLQNRKEIKTSFCVTAFWEKEAKRKKKTYIFLNV